MANASDSYVVKDQSEQTMKAGDAASSIAAHWIGTALVRALDAP